jgi:hypothetical protein
MQGDPPSGNATFRAVRYAPDFPGVFFKDLTPGAPIELYPATSVVDTRIGSGRFALAQNYPNPFRPGTTVAFSLRESANVTLDVYDIAGRHVANIVSQYFEVGEHRCEWWADGLAGGIYYYTLRVGPEMETRRMTILR